MEQLNILEKYFSNPKEISISPIENGLINHTFLVEDNRNQKKFILQKINISIFKNPEGLVKNQISVNTTLEKNKYPKEVIHLVPNNTNELLTTDNSGEVWRMMDFVENSKTYLKASCPNLARKAAQAFGEFYKFLNREKLVLEEVLPGFTDFGKRMSDFDKSLKNSKINLLENAKIEIEFVVAQSELPLKWIGLHHEHLLPERVIHADPKISNILFDQEDNPLFIIDLDTVMNASLLYDFGDMIRSYTNILDEDKASEENNFNPELFEAVKKGFSDALNGTLTDIEKENLDYAAQVVIYIQAVRFLTDYLNGSTYYSTKYEKHNLDRTKNQINLLKGLQTYLSEKN
ncbi:phosphotransferase enzyme family protein [Amniculibacterium sp. G2-70]|uniref:phosphotransferase enzyme family protein n=1 Tax=Amniculibacterium sp. G2-70 TaxID=2767188 RepID=UPI0021CCEE00|nr:aminoglycoside phosphotransferase family protein [Amniculibacterium sp. G2-70]